MLDKRGIDLKLLQDNLDPFVNTGITCADFNKSGKIPFSKELLVIAKRVK